MTTDITRRRFLQLSVTAAGGLAQPGGVGGRMLGGLAGKGRLVSLTTVTGAVCPTLLQSPWLGMAALGDPLREDPLKGVHLRWAFHPVLGFPPQGFDLYRRPHVDTQPRVCADLAPPHGTPVPVTSGRRLRVGEVVFESGEDIEIVGAFGPASGRVVDLRDHVPVSIWLDELSHHVQLEVFDLGDPFPAASGTIVATAFDGAVPVAVTRTVRRDGLQLLDLVADRIDHVVLGPGQDLIGEPISGRLTPMNGGLTRVLCATVADDGCSFINVDPTAGRVHLNDVCPAPAVDLPPCGPTPIFLPLSDMEYPGRLAARALEWPEAKRRTPTSRWPGSAATPVGGVPLDFVDLRDTLSQLYHPLDPDARVLGRSDPPCPPTSDEDPTSVPDGSYDPLGLVLLASLDPDIARVVGLYWIDGAYFVAQGRQGPEPAATAKRYDYLVVGHYPPTAAGATICDGWSADVPGTTIAARTSHGPLTYTPGPGIAPEVVAAAVPGLDAARALALRRTAGTESGTLTIQLPRPCRAVELYVAAGAGTVAAARALSHGTDVDAHAWRPSSSECASGLCAGTLLLAAEAIDTVVLDVALGDGVGAGTVLLGKTCVYDTYLPGGDIGWIVYDVGLDEPTPSLPRPASLSGAALPAASHLRTGADGACTFQQGTMAAGLRWDRDVSDGGLVPRGALFYDVWRQALGSASVAVAIDPSRWGPPAETSVMVVPRPDDCDAYVPPAGWPAERQDYIDTPPDPQARWYAYRIVGRDIFGRESDFTVSSPIDLADRVPPPPPVAVHARYLDPDDPHLTQQEHDWTHPGDVPQHQLYVEWHWPPNLVEQAPDTKEFRIYLHPGRMNGVVGAITGVTLVSESGDVAGEELYEIATDVALGPPRTGDGADAFKGEMLQQGSQLYPVVASSVAGGTLTLTVRRLVLRLPQPSAPAASGVAAAGRNGRSHGPAAASRVSVATLRRVVVPVLQPVPVAGAFSVSVRAPKPFAGTLQFLPGFYESPSPVGPTIVVETDATIDAPAGSLAGRGLRLVQRGLAWEIVGNGTGPHGTLELRRRDCDPLGREPIQQDPIDHEGFVVVHTVIRPGDGRADVQPFMLEEGNPYWRSTSEPANWSRRLAVVAYREPTGVDFVLKERIPISDPSGTLPLGRGTAYAAVGVSAADGSAYGVDAWAVATSTGSRAGNEGNVAGPALVVRSDFRKPDPPATLARTLMYATPANFHGRSTFVVRWKKTEDESLRYLVYRAVVDQRPNQPDGPGEAPPDEPDATMPDDTRWRISPEVRFVQITPEPLAMTALVDRPSHGHPDAEPEHLLAYVDTTLDGRSTSVYNYRVRAVRRSGTFGDMSGLIGPVQCPDVVGPQAPVITKALGGAGGITLTWARSSRENIREYRVYRAESKEAARDLRSMIIIHTYNVPSDGDEACPSEVCWIDRSPIGLGQYYYRVLAVSANDTSSQPSTVAHAQAHDDLPPAPPAWESVKWAALSSGLAVRLRWTSEDLELTCILQRRPASGGEWLASSPPLSPIHPGIWEFTDNTATPATIYEYRIHAIDRAGNASVAYDPHLLMAALV